MNQITTCLVQMLMLIHKETEDERNGSVISLTPAEIFKNFKKQDEERETLLLKERIKQTQDNLNIDNLDNPEVFYDLNEDMANSDGVSISSILMKPQTKKVIEIEPVSSSNIDKVKPIDILKNGKFNIQCKKNEYVEQIKLDSDIQGDKIKAYPTPLLKNGKFDLIGFEKRVFPVTLKLNSKNLKFITDKPIEIFDSEDENPNEKINPALMISNGKFNLAAAGKSKVIKFKVDPSKLRIIINKPQLKVSLQISSHKMKTIIDSNQKPVKRSIHSLALNMLLTCSNMIPLTVNIRVKSLLMVNS